LYVVTISYTALTSLESRIFDVFRRWVKQLLIRTPPVARSLKSTMDSLGDPSHRQELSKILCFDTIKATRQQLMPLHVLWASLTYCSLAVGTAIILDNMRRATIETKFGKMIAVLLELPVLLAVCWKASLWTTKKFAVSPHWTDRFVMGSLAFLYLILVEVAVSVFLLGWTWEELSRFYIVSFSGEKPADLLGRIGELLYGAMPLINACFRERDLSQRKKVKD